MQVEIWSDIMCPFCYIGKRKFEKALAQFDQKDRVEVIWRSFQLNPTMEKRSDLDLYDYLARLKGQTREWSVQVHNQLTEKARESGLDYHFEKAVIANSFDAHRLIQLAKTHNLGDAAEERLFRAYFTEGVDISDVNELLKLGAGIGLDPQELKAALEGDAYADSVKADEAIAQAIGVRGVPFFVVDQKYAVSGAQDASVFLEVLQKAWNENCKSMMPVSADGDVSSCSPGGDCAHI